MAPPVGWSGKATLASCRCFFPVHLLCAFCVLICSCCSTVFSSRTPETSHARYRWVQQDSVLIHHLWSLKAEAGQHVGTQGTCQETCDSITDLCCLLLTLWPVMAGDFEDWLQHTDDRSSWDPASENGEERDSPKKRCRKGIEGSDYQGAEGTSASDWGAVVALCPVLMLWLSCLCWGAEAPGWVRHIRMMLK